MMIVLLESKPIKGLVDTEADATSICLNDAKAFPHWKLKDGPTITGIKGDSTSKTTTNPVNWKDLDGNQRHFCPHCVRYTLHPVGLEPVGNNRHCPDN